MTIFFYKGLTRNPEIGNKWGEWADLWIPNLARMSLIECYWMLQNSRVTVFTIFEWLRGNQLEGGGEITLPPTQIRVHHLTENTNPDLYNGILDSYFIKLTLGSSFSELCFWRVTFKVIHTQQYYKYSSHFQTRALSTIRYIWHLYIYPL